MILYDSIQLSRDAGVLVIGAAELTVPKFVLAAQTFNLAAQFSVHCGWCKCGKMFYLSSESTGSAKGRPVAESTHGAWTRDTASMEQPAICCALHSRTLCDGLLLVAFYSGNQRQADGSVP